VPDGDRKMALRALDTLNVLVVAVPAVILPLVLTDVWLVRMVLFIAVGAIVGIPARRVFRPLYVRAGADLGELP
jgi:hypothetical protein